ncbi:MAG: hypothetical protein LBU39_06475 [Desulfobulbaceae bacterium]|jgi:curli biogenesis system outer membrane secretion channel CsgG|nr:hypothetical protein [Desulfobulbaceae bacterium]
MKSSATLRLALVLACLTLAACNLAQPKLSENERRDMKSNATPYTTDARYEDALSSIGKYINAQGGQQKVVQPKTIVNNAGGQELPFNVTDMVITGLNRLSGQKLIVAPFDPEYIMNDAQTGGTGSRMLPNLVVAGSITEFDKEVETSGSDANLDAILDRGEPDTNVSAEFSNGKKMSRVTLDLYLIDYRTHVVIPGASVTNTVNVVEVEKDRQFAFAIFGNGIGIGGKIKSAQGFHRAVRNLVDYSLLQLMGRYYEIEYWRILGMTQSDPEVRKNLASQTMRVAKTMQGVGGPNAEQEAQGEFASYGESSQIFAIQRLLASYKFRDVPNADTGAPYSPLVPDSDMSEKTKAFIEYFRKKYKIAVPAADLGGVYMELLKNLPGAGGKK